MEEELDFYSILYVVEGLVIDRETVWHAATQSTGDGGGKWGC